MKLKKAVCALMVLKTIGLGSCVLLGLDLLDHCFLRKEGAFRHSMSRAHQAAHETELNGLKIQPAAIDTFPGGLALPKTNLSQFTPCVIPLPPHNPSSEPSIGN